MVQPAAAREPLKFKPLLQSRIWGGDGLFRVLGKGDPSAKDVGESWELSDRQGAATVVAAGNFAGRDLRDVYSGHARDILGEQYSPSHAAFPLLYKFIYAREHLSVQVHPGEGSPLGEAKTECWYILDAPPDAKIILGIGADESRETLLAKLASKECRSVLNEVPVKAGDTVFIQAGTVHALTAGILLYEVQQNSDTTFRLYDWDRVDASGKGRPLHIRESAEVIDLRRHDKYRIKPLAVKHPGHQEDFLTACRHFALVKYSRFRQEVSLPSHNRFRVITAVKGSFELTWTGGAIPLGLGETALLPAACPDPRFKETSAGSEAIVSFIPLLSEEVVAPLRKAGHSDAEIRDLGGHDGFPL